MDWVNYVICLVVFIELYESGARGVKVPDIFKCYSDVCMIRNDLLNFVSIHRTLTVVNLGLSFIC